MSQWRKRRKENEQMNDKYFMRETRENYLNVSFGEKCNKKEIVKINVLPRVHVRACLRACSRVFIHAFG